jgi:hypothetical protein
MNKLPALSDDRIPLAMRRRAADAALDLVNAEVAFRVQVVMKDWPSNPTREEEDTLTMQVAAWRIARTEFSEAWQMLARVIRELDIVEERKKAYDPRSHTPA